MLFRSVLPVSNKVEEESIALFNQFKEAGFRVEMYDRGQLGKKIRDARGQRIPYLVVLGPRDVEAGTVSVRLRDDTELDPMSVEDFIEMAKHIADNRLSELVLEHA